MFVSYVYGDFELGYLRRLIVILLPYKKEGVESHVYTVINVHSPQHSKFATGESLFTNINKTRPNLLKSREQI